MSVYDDPDLAPDAEYVKFDKVGDNVTGVLICDPVKHKWDDGSSCFKYQIRTADGDVTLTASQIKLTNLLRELRPGMSDTVNITLTEIEKRAGGKTLKHFTLDVTPGNGTVPEAPNGNEEPF